MKGSLVADEMFPEGAGPYMDIDEVIRVACCCDLRSAIIIISEYLRKQASVQRFVS